MLQLIAPSQGRGAHQERLTTPIPGRLRRPGGGDVLVALSSGLAGKREEHREIAHDLGLKTWGDQVLGHRMDRGFMGKVDEIRHLVTVTRFSSSVAISELRTEYRAARRVVPYRRIPGTSWPSLAAIEKHTVPSGLESVVKREIPMIPNEEDLTGSIYELADDQYVQIEDGPDAGVVVWSSSLNVRDALTLVLEALGPPSDDDDGFVIHAGGAQELSSRDAEVIAMKRADEIHLVVAKHGDVRISWREPQVKLQGGQQPYVEFCYSAEEVHWSTLQDLIRTTASENVQEAMGELRMSIIRSLGRHAVA